MIKYYEKNIFVYLFIFILCTCKNKTDHNGTLAEEVILETEDSTSNTILDFLNLKFGMFIHYNMSTYHETEQWAYPFHDPKDFKPSELDCNQWAQAAKSAGMQYAVFTYPTRRRMKKAWHMLIERSRS